MNNTGGGNNLKDKKIFIVEDDQFFTELLSKRFATEGCELIYSPTGEDAVKKIENGDKPDLVLLDIMLPGIDGFEVLKKIKETDGWKDIPVIILSNLGSAEDIDKGMKLGAFRFIVKSTMVPKEVVDQVRDTLNK